MNELLFSAPWWLPTSVLIVGVLVWMTGNRRTHSATKWAGLAVIGLGVAWAAVSYLVETPVEQCARKSRELIRTAVDQDWNKMQALLDPTATLSVLNSGSVYSSRDAIVAGAKAKLATAGVGDAHVTSMETERQGEQITTSIDVFVDTSLGHPVPTGWQLDWQDAGGGNWTVRDIRCVKIGSFTGGDIRQHFPSPR